MTRRARLKPRPTEPLQVPEFTMPTDEAGLAEYYRHLFVRTILNNPFIPIIKPTLNTDGTIAVDPKTGRLMWGRPSPKQMEFLAYQGKEGLFGGAAGGGKDLGLSTEIPTTCGVSSIRNIAVGDQVFDRNGNVCTVLAKSEVLYNKTYRVEFDNGEVFIAGHGHLWVTMTDVERTQAIRRDDDWRAFRRDARPSRAVAVSKKPGVSVCVTRMNKERVHAYKSPPAGSIRTTEEIYQTRFAKSNRVNHSIALCFPLDRPPASLPIEPYLLGLWLGDGCSRGGMIGMMQSDMSEVEKFVRRDILSRSLRTTKTPFETVRWKGLTSDLRELNLLKNKHIPAMYLRASIEQRQELLRGLLDTDGYCDKRGQIELALSNRRLIKDARDLVSSLGVKATIRTRFLSHKNVKHGDSHRIKFVAQFPAFKLKRKLERQKMGDFRPTTARHYIVSVTEIPTVPTQCIKVDSPDGTFLIGRSMIPTHNSDALLMGALQFVEIPGYSAIIFRRTLKMLEKSGGLIPRSIEWGLKAKGATYNYTDRRWTFPSGATLEFGYIDHKKDLDNYQGGDWNFCGVDEAGQMEPEYIRYMFSRLRKDEGSRIPSRMRLASNPGGIGHEYLKRRFVAPGAPKFFVPSLVDDNPGLDVKDYVESLQELDPILKAQLLAGDWSAYEGGRFKKAWFKEFIVRLDYNGQPRYHLQIGQDKFTREVKFDDVGILVRDCYNVVTVDPACTEDDSNCPTAMGCYAITPNRDTLVLEVVRKFLDIDGIVPEIARLCEGYSPIWVGIEDAGAFAAISSSARKHAMIPAVKSISHESKSKLVRATPAIIRTQAGQVYTPPAGPKFPWVEDFVSECVQFTGDEDQDAYTDQVDQFAHCIRTVDRMGLGGPVLVYREGDERELEDKQAAQIEFLDIRKGLDFDDLDLAERFDQESRSYGGLVGWKRGR